MNFDGKTISLEDAHPLYLRTGLDGSDFLGGEPFVVFPEIGEGPALHTFIDRKEVLGWFAFRNDGARIEEKLNGGEQQDSAHKTSRYGNGQFSTGTTNPKSLRRKLFGWGAHSFHLWSMAKSETSSSEERTRPAFLRSSSSSMSVHAFRVFPSSRWLNGSSKRRT